MGTVTPENTLDGLSSILQMYVSPFDLKGFNKENVKEAYHQKGVFNAHINKGLARPKESRCI